MRLSKRSIHGGARASFGRGVSFVAVVLFFTLLASVALAPIGERAAAASVRIASVVSVSGTVEVKKSGGKKYFKAYKDMPLNAGDHLKTGNKSTVTIKVQDRADEATLGGGSSLYISELRDSSGKKKSNFTLWTGSMWVKASTLVSTEDEFEVETPTAVMGVRGTNLFVTVDPKTGESMFMIASGVGEVFSKNNGKKDDSPAIIYPSQMLNTYFDEEKRSEKDEVVPVSLEQFVQTAGPGVIEAIIRNKAAIDKENEKLLERLRQELDPSAGVDPEQAEDLDLKSISDLDRFIINLQNFVANSVNEAIKQEKLRPDDARKLVEEANRSLESKIDLVNAKPQELSDKEKEKQRLVEEAKRERERKQRQAEQELADKQRAQQELLDKVAEQARRLQEANQRAMEEQKRKAEEEYLKKLQEERLKEYQEAKKKLEQENARPTPVSTPNTPAQPTPTPLAINQPGTIEGPLEQTVSGSSSVYYGPSNGTVTIQGDLTLTGGSSATGSYTLRNMVIEGNLVVNVPNGSVLLLNSVTVEGSTMIADVAANTFSSFAEHGEEGIEVSDSDGARIVLQGDAADSVVRVTGAGETVLEGSYNGDVLIDGDASSIVLKGQFTGTVRVNVAGVQMAVDSGALFSGTLEINANGFSLMDTSNKVANIVTGQGVEVDPAILDNAKLSRLNQAVDAEAVLTFLMDNGYEEANLWHAEQLLELRGSGFESWTQAAGAIEEVLSMTEQGPALETEGEPSAETQWIAFTFDEDDPGYQRWVERVTEVQIYEGSLAEGQPERIVAVNGQGQGGAQATLDNGRLEIAGSVFAAPGSYTLKLTADGFEDVVHTFTLLPTDWLNGDMELGGPVTQIIIGSEDKDFGPTSELLEVPGDLILTGDGSGTYTLRNLSIAGNLTIDLPSGSVVLEGSVSVAESTYIEGISGGFAAGNGVQPLVAAVEPDNGFISSAQHGNMIDVMDEDGTAIRLEDEASNTGLRITGGGQVLLHGVYNQDVYVEAATALRIAGDAKVMASLHIYASDVELDVQGKVLEIVVGQQVEATASVQASQEQILSYRDAIMQAYDNSRYNEGEDLSGFKQALEAAGFELYRLTYLYLLAESLNDTEGYLHSLLDIRDKLKDWGGLENLAPDLNQGDLTIENTPYGQPLRFAYSGFIPPEGNEGQGDWPEGYEPFEWPVWFDETIGVTVRQEHDGEVIERYYPLHYKLSCVIGMPEECQLDWDMTMFHPGEATVTIHGSRYEWNEDSWPYEVVGLYDDTNLSFIIDQPEGLIWDLDGTTATLFVYGDEAKVFGGGDLEQPVTATSLSIRGSGSGTYTLQNVDITQELIVDIPNGSLVLGGNVRFGSMVEGVIPWITILDVNSSADGGLVINGLADVIEIDVRDSNEARLSLQTLPTVDKPDVGVYGSGTLKLEGRYGDVEVRNEVEGQGDESQTLAYRDVYIPAGTIVEHMGIYSNAGSIRLSGSEGSILSMNVAGQPPGGHDASITSYKSMLDGLLDDLNEALTGTNYNDFKPQFESVLTFMGIGQEDIVQSGAGMWIHLKTYNQSTPYFSLRQALSALRFFGTS